MGTRQKHPSAPKNLGQFGEVRHTHKYMDITQPHYLQKH